MVCHRPARSCRDRSLFCTWAAGAGFPFVSPRYKLLDVTRIAPVIDLPRVPTQPRSLDKPPQMDRLVKFLSRSSAERLLDFCGAQQLASPTRCRGVRRSDWRDENRGPKYSCRRGASSDAGPLLNLLALWQVRRLRGRAASAWRQKRISKGKVASEWFQLAISLATLAMLAMESYFHLRYAHHL